MFSKLTSILAATIALTGTTQMLAADDDATLLGTMQDEAASTDFNTGRISLDLGVDVTSAYFFRGYLQEDNGLIVQPWAEVGFDITPDNSAVDINLSIGTWSSSHDEETGATGTAHDTWYEADFYTGVAFGWESVELALTYTLYTYPNSDTFNDVQEFGATVTFDLPDDHWSDTWFGDVSIGLFAETDNSNVFTDEAIYFQIDFGPSFEFDNTDLTLSIPVSIGLSVDDYYVGTDDETFGFASIGAVVDYPLCSGGYGDWALSGGVTFLMLGDTTEAVNNGDDSDVFAFIGVSMSYSLFSSHGWLNRQSCACLVCSTCRRH